jgi:hypothetical protein
VDVDIEAPDEACRESRISSREHVERLASAITSWSTGSEGMDMTDPSNYAHGDDTDVGPDDVSVRHRTPGWVKVFAICIIALVLVFVVLHLTGGAPDTGH